MKLFKNILYALLAIIIAIPALMYGAEKYRQHTIYNKCKTVDLAILNTMCTMNISPFTNQSKYDIFYNALKEINKKEDVFIGNNKEQEIKFMVNYNLAHTYCFNSDSDCTLKSDDKELFRISLIKCLKTGNHDCLSIFLFNERQFFLSKNQETAKIIKEANYCSRSVPDGWKKEIEKFCKI
jgi:hypothetical protein